MIQLNILEIWFYNFLNKVIKSNLLTRYIIFLLFVTPKRLIKNSTQCEPTYGLKLIRQPGKPKIAY